MTMPADELADLREARDNGSLRRELSCMDPFIRERMVADLLAAAEENAKLKALLVRAYEEIEAALKGPTT